MPACRSAIKRRCRSSLPIYDCAITEYQATIAAHRKQPDATVDMARLQTAELEALSQRRDRSRSDQEAVRFNRALMSDATVMVKAAPAQGTAYYYLGDGLLS